MSVDGVTTVVVGDTRSRPEIAKLEIPEPAVNFPSRERGHTFVMLAWYSALHSVRERIAGNMPRSISRQSVMEVGSDPVPVLSR